jgi:hypothetical protein
MIKEPYCHAKTAKACGVEDPDIKHRVPLDAPLEVSLPARWDRDLPSLVWSTPCESPTRSGCLIAALSNPSRNSTGDR